jgi:hypothetical protein
MANETYTDKISIITDLKLYIANRNSQAQNLSMFPKLCADRWTWIVRNWDSSLYAKFLTQSNGDEYLLGILDRLDNHVSAWKEGAGVNPFQDMSIFADATEFLETILVTDLTPTPSESQFVAREVKRVAEFRETEFRSMLSFLRTQRDIAFDFIGLSDNQYDSFKKRSASPKQRDFFVSDLYQLDEAIELEKFIQGIILEFKYTREVEPNLLQFANEQLASGQSSVLVEDIYSSYITVPFEQTLEQMARDYLGTSNRWFELVTVNKLKPPYIDIHGQKILISENASANSLRVPIGDQKKFLVGASVKIGSRLVPDEVRFVELLRDNEDGTATVFLSGKQDLSKLRVEHLAYLRAYEPETVRDFSFIRIPVPSPAPYASVPDPTENVLKKLDKALYSFGVDIAVDDKNGDIVIGSSGDLSLQYGIPNVRQAVLSVVRTSLGELPLHPGYGIPETIGFALEGADSAVKISTIIEQAIQRDPRFTGVQISNIVISPEGKINMSVSVSVAGSNQLIPLAFVI